eukprot:Amastigsp_a350797_12.p3 type:complete len:151 gc:universal Amastigsp_a350797_12:244-696(+)
MPPSVRAEVSQRKERLRSRQANVLRSAENTSRRSASKHTSATGRRHCRRRRPHGPHASLHGKKARRGAATPRAQRNIRQKSPPKAKLRRQYCRDRNKQKPPRTRAPRPRTTPHSQHALASATLNDGALRLPPETQPHPSWRQNAPTGLLY